MSIEEIAELLKEKDAPKAVSVAEKVSTIVAETGWKESDVLEMTVLRINTYYELCHQKFLT